MEKVIEIRGDRVLIEQGGHYYEKPIDTLEQQEERITRRETEKVMEAIGMNNNK